jgi:hypothetical protein
MNTRIRFLSAWAALLTVASPGYSQVVLNVDQANGQVRILNTSTTETVTINGYDVRSSQSAGSTTDGLLNPSGWAKLATTLGNGWLATNFPSSELLLETNANNVLSLGPGASQSLGAAFTTNAATIGAAQSRVGFGNEYRDVTFQYTNAANGSAVTSGAVSYSNRVFNNLVLNVQPGTGNIQLKNESSVAVVIEAYTITSAAGSLNTNWNGLSDTVANWEKNIATSKALAEVSKLNPSSNPGAPLAPLTINGGATFDLGTAFNVGGVQDLSFRFLLTSDVAGNGFAGEVRYAAGVSGDYNGDARVDGADFLLWQRSYNASVTPGTGADGSGNGLVDAADLALWKSNFGTGGATVAATAIPEPTSLTAAMTAITLACLTVRRCPRPSLRER